MKKIRTLPVSGTMNIDTSEKLTTALRDFISLKKDLYSDKKIKKGELIAHFELDNGICIEQKLRIIKEYYICYTTLSIYIDIEQEIDQVAKYVLMANSINSHIDYGHFEINLRTGDILYKTFYEPNEIVSFEKIDMMLEYPRYIINKFGYCFLEISKV